MSFRLKKINQNNQNLNLKKVLFVLLALFLSIILVVAIIGMQVFKDVEKTATTVYESVDCKNGYNSRKVRLSEQKPFSILLLGVDTGSLGRTEQGRSDTIMVATINPNKEQIFLVSIPRDTYTKIIGQQMEDKINHAYAFGGAAMTIDTVEEFLDIPINHYITINMKGIETLVDQIGGIEVYNSLDFIYEGTRFKKGEQKLNGEQALKYSRMRYDDPNGDYGRQDRQRQIIIGIIKRGLDPKNLLNYRSILKTMGENMKTSLTFADMRTFPSIYRPAFNNIRTDQMKGKAFMKNEISYQKVEPMELQRIQKELKRQLR